MQTITPFLWFDNQAEEAANFYVSIFPNSKVGHIARYGDSGPGPKESVMIVEFQLNGQEFTGLNGGPMFKFTEAISLMVNCKDQKEVDYYWEKLLQGGGEEVQCGWLKDRYGLSWQIVPAVFFDLMKDKDTARSDRVMKAMMEMVKFDIGRLREAYDG